MTVTTTIQGILTEQQICERFNVTPEEIDRATRCIDMQTGGIFYVVSSRSGGDDHKVTYNRKHKCLVCTCKAGQEGRECWARRAAMAAARLHFQDERLAMAREVAEHKQKEQEKIQAQAHAVVSDQVAKLEKQRDEARASVAGLKAGKGVKQARVFSLLA